MLRSGPDPATLLHPTPAGLYCPAGDFHVDPVRPVARALITHAHSDHARAGHGEVLATQETLEIMAIRMGEGFCRQRQIARFGERLEIGGIGVRFHPAGHVLGSAQIALEGRGLRLTVSGDYKRRADPTCAAFEPVPSDVFVTEATFALPVFQFPPPEAEIARLLASLAMAPERAHLIGAYALGKAQRVIALLRAAGYDAPIAIHGAMRRLCDYYIARGVALGPLVDATAEGPQRGAFPGGVVIAPPSAFGTRWASRFAEPLQGFASGWMRIRARARQRGAELALILSDHCDWPELTQTLQEIAPAEVWVTHGREDALIRWCALNGLAARPLHLVGYQDEEEE